MTEEDIQDNETGRWIQHNDRGGDSSPPKADQNDSLPTEVGSIIAVYRNTMFVLRIPTSAHD